MRQRTLSDEGFETFRIGFNTSVAVGYMALAGVAAEIGGLVLTFIDQEVLQVRQASGKPLGLDEILLAAQLGTAERVRPIVRTTAITISLPPIFWGHGTGSETLRRVAAHAQHTQSQGTTVPVGSAGIEIPDGSVRMPVDGFNPRLGLTHPGTV